MNNKVLYDYDYNGDSLFIYCADDYEYEVSVELNNDVILDLDVEDKPVAFEFLNASRIFKLEKNLFKNIINICIHSNIMDESISLKVELVVVVLDEQQTFDLNMVTNNLEGILSIESELAYA